MMPRYFLYIIFFKDISCPHLSLACSCWPVSFETSGPPYQRMEKSEVAQDMLQILWRGSETQNAVRAYHFMDPVNLGVCVELRERCVMEGRQRCISLSQVH